MSDHEDRGKEKSEFGGAQEDLHRQLQEAQMLSEGDRSSAEKQAWSMYNQRMGLDW